MKSPNPQAVKSYRNSSRYKRWRKKIFLRDTLCVMCLKEGIRTATAEIDHRLPLLTHWELRWDEDNAQGLCREHHAEKTKAENDLRFEKSRGPLWNAFNEKLAEMVENV